MEDSTTAARVPGLWAGSPAASRRALLTLGPVLLVAAWRGAWPRARAGAGAPRPRLEVTLHMLLAAPAGPRVYPPALAGVVDSVGGSLGLRSFVLVGTEVERFWIGQRAGAEGAVQVTTTHGTERLRYAYGFEGAKVLSTGGADEPPRVQLARLNVRVEGEALGSAEVDTGLTLREGDLAVVGTAGLKQHTLVLVLGARTLP
jgi:hypothetical protein